MAHDDHAHGHDHSHDHGKKGRAHDHAHDHGHDHARHSHNHAHAVDESSEGRIAWAALITGGFMMVEVVGGLFAGSLALIADAGHMLSDFASLLLAWVGFRMARRPADMRRTFGFRRFSVLAAFVNGLALFVIAAWIVYEAIIRLNAPREILAGAMLWVAAGGFIANLMSFAILHGADRDNLNVRGALLHVAGDLFGSLAAIVAALIIMTTGWTPADPILSVVVALIILRSAWALVAESGHILLEGAPAHIDISAVSRDLAEHVDGVIDIHHAHAWSLDGRQTMMTLHARIADTASGPTITALIKKRLADVHKVGHATIEIEHGDCASADCA